MIVIRRPRCTIGRRLALVVLVSVLGFGGLAVITLGLVDDVRIGGALYERLRAHAQRRLDLAALGGLLSDLRADTIEAIHEKDRDRLAALYDDMRRDEASIERRLGALAAQLVDPDEHAAVVSLQATWGQFALGQRRIADMLDEDLVPDAELLEMQHRREGRFGEQVDALLSLLLMTDDEVERGAQDTVRRRRLVVVAAGAALGLGVLVLTMLITRSIMVPLRRLARACDRVAAGDL
jgi:methyl-accepting chemotaxis protein